MSNEKIAKILDAHSVDYRIEDGRILADTCETGTTAFEVVDDLTGSSKRELLLWLGY